MKKIKAFAVLMILALSLCFVGCEIVEDLIPSNDADDLGLSGENFENKGEEDNETEGKEDEGNGDTSSESQPETEHTCNYVYYKTIESTCTEKGKIIKKCECGKLDEEPLELSAHTPQTIPAVEAENGRPAKTEGKACSVCGYVIVKQEFVFASEYENPEKYDGDYAYNYLTTLNNAEMLTKFYNSIDEIADDFHVSDKDLGSDKLIGKAYYNKGEIQLSAEEALAVWSAYVIDHPLYYWMSKSITYTSSYLNLHSDEEYLLASARSQYNSEIYKRVEEYVKEISGEKIYDIALTFHDLIIYDCDYAYEADGETPKDDNYAHNVIGAISVGEGVCESYSKTFQLLLNYCDIENVFVAGMAGDEAHAWNLVKMDDGGWYWFDLTWDDDPEFMWGVSHRYFCVNDSEALRGIDGPWVVDSASFTTKHRPYAKCDTGVNFTYELPARSTTKYSSSDALLRKTFEVDGLTYAICGYDSVQLVKINKAADVTVPEGVSYKGYEFEVISIGRIEGELFKTGSVAFDYSNTGSQPINVTSIFIPKSVIFIWDDALNIEALTEINVDEGNESFKSVDGVLFTKDLSVIIKYPAAKSATEYVLPTQTVKIAAGAFSMFYSNHKMNLTCIRLSADSVLIGIANWGYGYEDTENGNLESAELVKIYNFLATSGVVLDKNGNAVQ